MHKPFPDNNRGFTLVETALALLVIGLAFLGILGLGRSGLQAAKEAGNESRCETMAEAVFETLQLYNARFADYARTNDLGHSWAYMWGEAVTTEKFFPFPRVEGMSESEELFLQTSQGDRLVNAYDPSRLSLSEWNPRYRLYVTPRSTSTLNNTANTLEIFLFIYPDGDTYSSQFRLFSTILNRQGGI